MSINYISDKADQNGDFMIKLKEGNMSRKVEDGQQQVMYTKEGSSEIKQWKSSVSDGNIVLNSQDMPDINQSGTYSVVVTVNGEIFPSTGKVTLTLESSYPTKDNIKIQTITGPKGDKGDPGLSAYQEAVNSGFAGTKEQWLDSLQSKVQGKSAYELAKEAKLPNTTTEEEWLNSLKSDVPGPKGDIGLTGKSAYEEAKSLGLPNTDTEKDWLNSLHSVVPGPKGDTGLTGKSAYQVALDNGYQGTEAQWLEYLHKGPKGDNGLSAFEIALKTFQVKDWIVDEYKKGNKEKAEADWIKSLQGKQGDDAFAVALSFPNDSHVKQAEAIYTKKHNVSSFAYDSDNKTLNGSKDAFTEIEQYWLDSYQGKDGESAFQLATDDIANNINPKVQNKIEELLNERDQLEAQKKHDEAKAKEKEAITVWLNSLNGKGAFEYADEQYYNKNGKHYSSVQEWLNTLKGKDGDDAFVAGLKSGAIDVTKYIDGVTTIDYSDKEQVKKLEKAYFGKALKGDTGDSAFQLATKDYTTIPAPYNTQILQLMNQAGNDEFAGKYDDAKAKREKARDLWLESLKGESAFKQADDAYYDRTNKHYANVNEWLDSLKSNVPGPSGSKGDPGLSAYEEAKSLGLPNTDTKENWLNSLKSTVPGPKGDPGLAGKSAYQVAVDGGFKGTETDWLKSLKGKDSTVPGPTGKSAYELAKEAKLPNTTTEEEWLDSLKSTVPGPKGDPGLAGKSAYQVAVDGGFKGTETQWIESLKGKDSTVPGPTGKSAYELAKEAKLPNTDTETDWLNSLKSTAPGPKGDKGDPGLSAYQEAVNNGFKGSEAQWLDSLQSKVQGKSAYELAKEAKLPNTTTEEEWLDSLKSTVPGPKGDPGLAGKSAYQVAVDGGFKGTETDWLKSLKGKDSTVPGPKGDSGKSAYEEAKALGLPNTDTETDWLNSLKGKDGASNKTASFTGVPMGNCVMEIGVDPNSGVYTKNSPSTLVDFTFQADDLVQVKPVEYIKITNIDTGVQLYFPSVSAGSQRSGITQANEEHEKNVNIGGGDSLYFNFNNFAGSKNVLYRAYSTLTKDDFNSASELLNGPRISFSRNWDNKQKIYDFVPTTAVSDSNRYGYSVFSNLIALKVADDYVVNKNNAHQFYVRVDSNTSLNDKIYIPCFLTGSQFTYSNDDQIGK